MVRYSFDGYIENKAFGWVFDPNETARKFTVELVVNGAKKTEAVASRYRKDLEIAGLGTGHCAFCFDLPGELEGDICLKISECNLVIEESIASLGWGDPVCNSLLQNKDFSGYNQFETRPNNYLQAHSSQPDKSARLRKGLNRTVGHFDGFPLPAHAAWAIERNRQGGAHFFSDTDSSQSEDLLWYLFDYNRKGKELVELDANNQFNTGIAFAPFRNASLLFIAWLLRRGKAVESLGDISELEKAEFLGSLVAANLNSDNDLTVQVLTRYSNLRPKKIIDLRVPKITRYLKWKYQAGYRDIYQFDDKTGFLAFLFDCLIHTTSAEIRFLGEQVIDYFKVALRIGDVLVSRFEFLVWAYTEKRKTGYILEKSKLDGESIKQFFDSTWIPQNPVHAIFRSDREFDKKSSAAGCHCYIVANWNSTSGLTQNAVMSAKAMRLIGLSVIQLLPDGSVFQDVDPLCNCATGSACLKRDVILLHVNADEAPQVQIQLAAYLDIDRALVVGYYLWELEVLPCAHELGIDLVDEIWTPTRFVNNAYSTVAPKKTHRVGKAIQIPALAAPDRGLYQIPEKHVVYLLSFDYHSGIERKNPLAAVAGFLEAFQKDEKVTFIIKSTEFVAGHWGDPFAQWNRVMKLAENDDRIIVIEDYLEDQGFFELINMCDVVVSTHRSEGFGYLPAYALGMGKKVVVTNYSGTSDYCKPGNSYLVDYELAPVPSQKFIYPVQGAKWAEVNQDSLVGAYRKSYQDLVAGKKKPAAATNTFLRQFSYKKLAETYRARLTALGALKAAG